MLVKAGLKLANLADGVGYWLMWKFLLVDQSDRRNFLVIRDLDRFWTDKMDAKFIKDYN